MSADVGQPCQGPIEMFPCSSEGIGFVVAVGMWESRSDFQGRWKEWRSILLEHAVLFVDVAEVGALLEFGAGVILELDFLRRQAEDFL